MGMTMTQKILAAHAGHRSYGSANLQTDGRQSI